MIGNDLRFRYASSQPTKYVSHRDAHAAHARLAAVLARLKGDDPAIVHRKSFQLTPCSSARNFSSAASTSLPLAAMASSSSAGVRVSVSFFSRGLTAFKS
jgi:hypothetical protein